MPDLSGTQRRRNLGLTPQPTAPADDPVPPFGDPAHREHRYLRTEADPHVAHELLRAHLTTWSSAIGLGAHLTDTHDVVPVTTSRSQADLARLREQHDHLHPAPCGRRSDRDLATGGPATCSEPAGHGRVSSPEEAGDPVMWWDHADRPAGAWWGRGSTERDQPDGPPLTGPVNGFFVRDAITGHVSLEQAVDQALAAHPNDRAGQLPDGPPPAPYPAREALLAYLADWRRGVITPVTTAERAERDAHWDAARTGPLTEAEMARFAAALREWWGEHRDDEPVAQVLAWLDGGRSEISEPLPTGDLLDVYVAAAVETRRAATALEAARAREADLRAEVAALAARATAVLDGVALEARTADPGRTYSLELGADAHPSVPAQSDPRPHHLLGDPHRTLDQIGLAAAAKVDTVVCRAAGCLYVLKNRRGPSGWPVLLVGALHTPAGDLASHTQTPWLDRLGDDANVPGQWRLTDEVRDGRRVMRRAHAGD